MTSAQQRMHLHMPPCTEKSSLRKKTNMIAVWALTGGHEAFSEHLSLRHRTSLAEPS